MRLARLTRGSATLFFAFGLADGFAPERVTVQDSVLRSLKTHNGILVACADEINGEKHDVDKVPFSIRAYNTNALEDGPLWSHEGTFSNTVDVINGDDYPYVGSPEIQAVLPGDSSSALVSAGTDLLLFDLEGGDLLYSHSFFHLGCCSHPVLQQQWPRIFRCCSQRWDDYRRVSRDEPCQQWQFLYKYNPLCNRASLHLGLLRPHPVRLFSRPTSPTGFCTTGSPPPWTNLEESFTLDGLLPMPTARLNSRSGGLLIAQCVGR